MRNFSKIKSEDFLRLKFQRNINKRNFPFGLKVAQRKKISKG